MAPRNVCLTRGPKTSDFIAAGTLLRHCRLGDTARTVLEGSSLRPARHPMPSSPQAPAPASRPPPSASETSVGAAPRISIVIPVYNEEAILHAAVVDLRERLKPIGWTYEIILAENGSRDRTVEIGQELAAKYGAATDGQVKIISIGEPNYGKALKQGILLARGTLVICDEIDLCDADFHRRAVEILETGEADLVIGSKLVAGAEDDRPAIRHAASIAYSTLLQAAARLPRHRHARAQGVPPRGAPRHRPLVPRRQGRLRERARHPRRSRRRPHARDPRARHREASAVDQPLQARSERAEERREAHVRDPRSRVTPLEKRGRSRDCCTLSALPRG